MFAQQRSDKIRVSNIAGHKLVAPVVSGRQRIQIAGISQLIQIQDTAVPAPHTPANKAASNKSSSASYKNRFHKVFFSRVLLDEIDIDPERLKIGK
jgi:hypothetical protein